MPACPSGLDERFPQYGRNPEDRLFPGDSWTKRLYTYGNPNLYDREIQKQLEPAKLAGSALVKGMALRLQRWTNLRSLSIVPVSSAYTYFDIMGRLQT